MTHKRWCLYLLAMLCGHLERLGADHAQKEVLKDRRRPDQGRHRQGRFWAGPVSSIVSPQIGKLLFDIIFVLVDQL